MAHPKIQKSSNILKCAKRNEAVEKFQERDNGNRTLLLHVVIGNSKNEAPLDILAEITSDKRNFCDLPNEIIWHLNEIEKLNQFNSERFNVKFANVLTNYFKILQFISIVDQKCEELEHLRIKMEFEYDWKSEALGYIEEKRALSKDEEKLQHLCISIIHSIPNNEIVFRIKTNMSELLNEIYNLIRLLNYNLLSEKIYNPHYDLNSASNMLLKCKDLIKDSQALASEINESIKKIEKKL